MVRDAYAHEVTDVVRPVLELTEQLSLPSWQSLVQSMAYGEMYKVLLHSVDVPSWQPSPLSKERPQYVAVLQAHQVAATADSKGRLCPNLLS